MDHRPASDASSRRPPLVLVGSFLLAALLATRPASSSDSSEGSSVGARVGGAGLSITARPAELGTEDTAPAIPPGLRSPSASTPCFLLVPIGARDLERPERLEPILSAAAASGLKVVARLLEDGWLAAAPPEADPGEPAQARALAHVRAWGERLAGLMALAGDRVAAYQIFATPAASLPPREFAYLLKHTAGMIRSVRPGARLVLGPIGSADAAWAEALLTGDVALYFDVLAARTPADLPTAVDLGIRLAPRAAIWVTDAEIDPGAPAASMVTAYLESLAQDAETILFAPAAALPPDQVALVGERIARLRALVPPGLFPTTAASLPFVPSDDIALPLAFYDPGRQEGMIAYRAPAKAPTAPEQAQENVESATPPQAPDLTEPSPRMARLSVRSPLEWVDLVDPQDGATRRLAANVPRGAVLAVAVRPEYFLLKYRFQGAPPSLGAQVGASTELTAEEIIARERQTRTAQEARLRHYEARASIGIHYTISGLDQSVDVVSENRLFVHDGKQDYEQTDLFVDGARWRGKSPPYLPFLQPDKVKEVPLDITLDEGYRYALIGRERVDGRDCYVLSIDPVATDRSLYQGRVSIDAALFTRVRMDAVQRGLMEPLRSNHVSYHFGPVPAPGGEVWLPIQVTGEMVFEVLGQNLVVERRATYSDFSVNQDGFHERVSEAYASGRPLSRETDEGYFRLDAAGGEEVIRSASTPRNVFLVMGVSTGFGSTPGLPFAGVNFFDFNFKNSGTQFNLAWAGPFADIAWTEPKLFDPGPGRRPWALALEGSFNALARKDRDARASGTLSAENVDVYTESVRALLAIPTGNFLKWTLEGRATWFDFARLHDETADAFVLPPSMIQGTAGLRLEYNRLGYLADAWGESGTRSRWHPWGLPGTSFDPEDRTFTRLGIDLLKTFYFGSFRKASFGVQGYDGRGLDRFSRFELGDFRSARVHGFNGSGIHFDRGLTARGGYGITLGQSVRLDADIEAGWIQSVDDFGPGYERVTGGSLACQFSAPWSTLAIVSISRGLSSTIEGKGGSGDLQVILFRTFDRWSRRPKSSPPSAPLPSPDSIQPRDR